VHKYNETPPYSHLANMITTLLRPLFYVLAKHPFMYIYLEENPISVGSPVTMANGHILKSQPVQSHINLFRLYRHSNQLCSFFQC